MPSPTDVLNRVAVIVITGGSSGIGSALIKAILRLNSELLICNLSRTKPDFFLGKSGEHFPTDLTDAAQLAASAARVSDCVAQAAPGEVILINNSGFGDYAPQPNADANRQLAMIDLNIRAVVDLTHRLLPLLQERGGAVVNIASIAGFQATPYLATYGASKAFVLNWSLALDAELRDSKVRALTVCPGPTRSNFFKAAGFATPPMQGNGLQACFDMSAEEVAQRTLEALAKGQSIVVTGWLNRCIAWVGQHAPKVWGARIGAALLRRMRFKPHAAVKLKEAKHG